MVIYRLMAEVHHFLAGVFCQCRRRVDCQQYSTWTETHGISRESDGDYGFYLTNAWDRWNLVLLYSVVFAYPDSDPLKMQAARRDMDSQALERYIEKLVPEFQKYGNFFNRYKSETLLELRLRGRLDRERSRLPKCTISSILYARQQTFTRLNHILTAILLYAHSEF